MYDGSSLLLETPYRDRTIRAPIRHTIDVLILILYGFGKTNINISRLIIVVIINIIHCRRRRVYRWKEANGVKESSSWTKKVVYILWGLEVIILITKYRYCLMIDLIRFFPKLNGGIIGEIGENISQNVNDYINRLGYWEGEYYRRGVVVNRLYSVLELGWLSWFRLWRYCISIFIKFK